MEGKCGKGGLALGNTCLIKDTDTRIYNGSVYLGSLAVVMSYCHLKSEQLFGVAGQLNNLLQNLSQVAGNFTFVGRVGHPQINFDKSLCEILLRCKLALTRTNQTRNNTNLAISVCKVNLAVRVHLHFVNCFGAIGRGGRIGRKVSLRNGDGDLNLVVIVISSFFLRV